MAAMWSSSRTSPRPISAATTSFSADRFLSDPSRSHGSVTAPAGQPPAGGDGHDVFRFEAGDGRDTIADFDELDTLIIYGVNDQGDFFDLDISNVKGGALIEYDGGQIFLKGAKAADFSWMDDFG
jgi:hypothetical protein